MRGKRVSLLLAMVVVLAPALWAQEQAQTAVSDIRQESNDRSTRLIVECTGPVAYTYYSPDPLTLVVDMPEVDASTLPARIDVGTREVESLRVTNMARGDGRPLARLEVRLASLAPFQIYSKDRNLNLVFERQVSPGARAAEAEPETSSPEPGPKPAPTEVVTLRASPGESSIDGAPRRPAPEPPRPPAAPSTPATRILGVTQSGSGDQVTLTVEADGRLDYQDFFLGNPDRLVVDFPGVLNRAPRGRIAVGQGPVQQVRIAQFSPDSPRVARLVLDLSERAPYQIVEATDGLKIVFGEGQAPAPAPLASLRPVEPALVEPATALPPPAATPLIPEQAPAQEADFLSIDSTSTDGTRKYTGHPINLDFKDGDLIDIFRLFAEISGLNVVINPGVTGKVSLRLTEVPWDQALDLILKTNGLGRTIDDNVIRIAKLADLQREQQELRKLQEEKELAGNLQSWRKTLAYAKAAGLSPTVQKVALSPRGSITLDERTNTMIITDLPDRIDQARDLIADLDRATPQVEIEARIVVTSRDFARDIGIQWGFNHQQTPQFGNTTDRVFPNAIVVNGQAVPSEQGIAPGVISNNTSSGIGNDSNRGYAVNLPAASFTSGIGISLGNILGNFNLDAALTALETQGRGRVLSAPKITTQNNRDAEIKQGVQIPIQTVANNTVTTTFKDAVLTLRVTPQITDAGTVILDLEVKNDSPDFAREVNGIPPINTQSARTNVLVKDGATTVIGGVFQSDEFQQTDSVPVFSKIPVLGWLFKNRSTRMQNRELLLFISPRIVKS
jgi:type IV pilus secretin PilQ/predicted competence protein